MLARANIVYMDLRNEVKLDHGGIGSRQQGVGSKIWILNRLHYGRQSEQSTLLQRAQIFPSKGSVNLEPIKDEI